MTQPRVSVLINNYNYAAFLARAIDSSLSQSGPPPEVIVVDDGSTDDSRRVIESYGTAVTGIFQPNGGQASAMNAAVRASTGDILCFLDADDWWLDGKLQAVTQAFERQPDVGLVYHRLLPTGSDGRVVSRPIPRTLCSGNLAPRLARTAGVWPFPMTSAISVSRDAWKAVGEIPECFRISADAWLVGAIPFLYPVQALSDVLGGYRIHNNNWHRSSDDDAMLRQRMAHWQTTVVQTNTFLNAKGLPWRLRLADHYPHRVAAGRLAGNAGGVGMFLHGLRFAGEPHFLRRTRDALRSFSAS